MASVTFKAIRNDVGNGYELQSIKSDASIQDLLNDLNSYFEVARLDRAWPGDRCVCKGCDYCCHEPLPLTSVDVINLGRALGITFEKVFDYLWVEVEQHVVDITLRRVGGDRCIFLSSEETCSIYNFRPFVCQTYLCCPTGPLLEQVRSEIVNTGMDDLVRRSLQAFIKQGGMPANRSRHPRLRLEHWPRNAFSDKESYSQIPLKKVLTSGLHRTLLV